MEIQENVDGFTGVLNRCILVKDFHANHAFHGFKGLVYAVHYTTQQQLDPEDDSFLLVVNLLVS